MDEAKNKLAESQAAVAASAAALRAEKSALEARCERAEGELANARDELRRAVLPLLAAVDKRLEGLLERVAKMLVVVEGGREDLVQLLLEVEQVLHQATLALRIGDHRGAHALNVGRKSLAHLGQRIDQRVEAVHILQVVDPALIHEVREALFSNRVHVRRKQRLQRRRQQQVGGTRRLERCQNENERDLMYRRRR